MPATAPVLEIELADRETVESLIQSVQPPTCGRQRSTETKPKPKINRDEAFPTSQIAAVFFIEMLPSMNPSLPDHFLTSGGLPINVRPPQKWRHENLFLNIDPDKVD